MTADSLANSRKRTSLNNRLMLLMVLCSGVSLLFSTVAFVCNDLRLLRAAKVAEATSVARLAAWQCAQSLRDSPGQPIEEIVNSLQGIPEIRAASLVDLHGNVRGGFDKLTLGPQVALPLEELGHRFLAGGLLDVTLPVGSTTQPLGRLQLRFAVDDLHGQLSNHTAIASAVLIASLLVATLFSSQLRSIISRPVLNLAETAQRISTEGDYSLRVQTQTDDEIGLLYDQFNLMLDRIQYSEMQLTQTHQQLQEAHDQLEQRVAQRTEELSAANRQLKQEMKAREQVHRELEASEQRVRAVMNSAGDGLITFDDQGEIESVSPAATRILGYTEDELLGESLERVFPKLDLQSWITEMRASGTGDSAGGSEPHEASSDIARRPGKVLREIEGQTRDGRAVPIELNVNRVVLKDRELYTAFARDLTERKLAEQQLAEVHQQLVDASRHAGMAEVANGVLHNVGNVLNSVNVAASMITETVNTSEIGDLLRVLEMIEENAEDLGEFLSNDPRGGPLVDYLVQAKRVLDEERTSLMSKTQSLVTKVEHIKTIVATQQSYAGMTGVEQKVVLQDLMEDALHINSGSIERYLIDIERDYENLPEASVDKQKILQILINLVANAKHAIRDHGQGRGRIRLTVRREEAKCLVGTRASASDAAGEESSSEYARAPSFFALSVEDDGLGIPPENLEKIFRHGFTTKRDGHGFGLHSAALTAKELGGSLSVSSAGPGQGACFTLRIPANHK